MLTKENHGWDKLRKFLEPRADPETFETFEELAEISDDLLEALEAIRDAKDPRKLDFAIIEKAEAAIAKAKAK